MNKKGEKHAGNYTNSIRTSGEVGGVFFRIIEVICILVSFMASKLRLIY